MKIYTKTGDDGSTHLFSGGRVTKTHRRVEAYGTVDELNSVIGMARVLTRQAQTATWLETVQNQLFYLGADLATPIDAQSSRVVRIDDQHIAWLEQVIDSMTGDLPELRRFILPGGAPAAAQLHIARTVCRRAERRVVELAHNETIGEQSAIYLNRLSDFLFTLARWENQQEGIAESEWSVRD